MPALNFKKQFSPSVRDGSKLQTIRMKRKHPIKVADKLFLYTGMRTKQHDYCVLPASSEADHRTALEYAQAQLESLWDSTAWEGSPKTVTVTMEIKEEDMPLFDDEEA